MSRSGHQEDIHLQLRLCRMDAQHGLYLLDLDMQRAVDSAAREVLDGRMKQTRTSWLYILSTGVAWIPSTQHL